MAALPLLGDQLRVYQLFEVEGEGGVSHFRGAEQLCWCSAFRPCRDEVTKKVKTPRVGESPESAGCRLDIHISILIEIIFQFDEKTLRS